MNWFTGSIPEAIGLAKSTNAIFVVYVYDSSDASTATSETLAEAELATVLNSKKFVAIKLENGTEGSNQFSQIYPVVILPSLYFISGSTGMPLEILGGAVAKDKLKAKLQEFTKDAQIPPAASNNVTEEPSGSTPEKMEVEETSTSTAVVNDNSSQVSDSPEVMPNESEKEVESMSEESSDAAGNSAAPLEERLDRAKTLLNEKQAKKAEETAEDQKKKEVERRKIGQEVAKRKRQMHDEEIQTAARERKKEKDDDRAARERVKAQIAADRLERETRAALLQGDASVPAQELPSAAAAAAPVFSTNRDDTVTRLKFRLPDGSSSIAQFPVEATLSEVRQHVQQLVSSSSFALTSTVHHRPFTSQDDDTSLLDLGLVPTAIIVVLLNARPYAGSSVVSSEGGMMQFLWILLSPITFLLGFVRQIFSGGRSDAASQSSTNEPGGERTSSTNPQQRPTTSYGRRQRENRPNREGNIHRLNNTNDEDDNNTWNGNSTQQM